MRGFRRASRRGVGLMGTTEADERCTASAFDCFDKLWSLGHGSSVRLVDGALNDADDLLAHTFQG
jgi:hypothetical protein